MKRSLLLVALAAAAQRQQPRSTAQLIPIEPGHVMSREKWERMQQEQQSQQK